MLVRQCVEAEVPVFDLVVVPKAPPLFWCLSQAVEVMLAPCLLPFMCLGCQPSGLCGSIAQCLVTPAGRPRLLRTL